MARGLADLLPSPAPHYPWGIIMENVLTSPGVLDTITRHPGLFDAHASRPPSNTATPPAGTGGVEDHRPRVRWG